MVMRPAVIGIECNLSGLIVGTIVAVVPMTVGGLIRRVGADCDGVFDGDVSLAAIHDPANYQRQGENDSLNSVEDRANRR